MSGETETLGAFLKRTRIGRGLTLRKVETITKGRVSNAAVSQIESGKIKHPSVMILHALAAAYAIDFVDLCERSVAGNPPPPEPPVCPHCGQVLMGLALALDMPGVEAGLSALKEKT